MSLLLEALKKAELAKKSASVPQDDLSLRQDPVITRDTLPDISQPLEIRPNDLPSADGPLSVVESTHAVKRPAAPDATPYESMDTASAFDAPPGPAQQTAARDASGEQRAAARQVFEAKEMDYNPRRPFYITMGLLVLCAAGYGGYVWWQLQPRSMYQSLPPGAQTSAAPDPQATQAAAPTNPPQQTSAPQAAPAVASAALPDTGKPAVKPESAQTPVAKPAAPTAETRGVKPAAARPAARGDEPQGATSSISITPPAATLDPQVVRGYEAFQLGDLAAAREQYLRALQSDPANRDALLGMAAIDISTRNFESAESRYLKLLETNPRDAHAVAGIMGLRGHTDPVQSESRLKGLIASQPDAAHLHFALGNQYAAQVRWPEAQAAYFKAYTLDPENPDFAFNVAVSLDHLRQGKLALEYYQRAMTLAGNRASGFDRRQAATRIAELSR